MYIIYIVGLQCETIFGQLYLQARKKKRRKPGAGNVAKEIILSGFFFVTNVIRVGMLRVYGHNCG